MKLKIAVLAGDGIGPEIMEQGVKVMSAVCEKFGHEGVEKFLTWAERFERYASEQ